MKSLIYLHGFNSSAKSKKAVSLGKWIVENDLPINYIVPELPWRPTDAITGIKSIIEESQGHIALIGSSLGGYYANYLSENFNIKAVLINPAVYPALLLKSYLGKQENPYTREVYYLSLEHMEELEKLFINKMISPENRKVLLQTGDETLDYREAEKYYKSSDCIVEQGGDHSFQNIEKHFNDIIQFLELK